MRYYKFTAVCCGNSHTYYQSLKEEMNIKEAKKHFQNIFSWMKITNFSEITKEEYKAFIERIQKSICKSDKSIRNELSFKKEYAANDNV